jgi:signal transduction histidine kinase
MFDEISRLSESKRILQEKVRELKAVNERLREIDRLKDDFLSVISHELRTPLTSIRSFSEILFDHPDMNIQQRKQFLGIIITESERLTRLLNQLLDLAKIESGRMEWRMVVIDPKEAIETALAVTRGLFREGSIRLDTNLPEYLPRVHIDPDRFMQVIVNLLSNATKFCDPEDGWVGVDAAVESSALRVNVRDNGAGIAPNEQTLIFEKFQRAVDTLTDKPQGTGLGLPVCRQIVEHFGGRIWVESTPGEGAVFSFTVPVAGEGCIAEGWDG